jgi:glucose/arabinose dehydrogenase
MMFYTGAQLPEARGDAFVTYHGSWNRSKKAGYCVTRVRFEDGHPWGEQVYIRFLTPEGQVLGRPVDVVQTPDGSLLISDDEGGRIYRLSFTGGAGAPGK